jgi:polyisoprenoid-binding protein YceI
VTPEDLVTTSTDAVIAPATYRIDPAHSVVRFTARGAFGMRVRGTFQLVAGTITVEGDRRRSTVTAVVDTASVETHHRRRDADLRSARFLHTARFPRMHFSGQAADGDTVSGSLRVQQTDQPVVLAVRGEPTADGAHFLATARVDRYAAGVVKGRGLVGRWVDLELDITAAPA